ncbi:hypothetical protein HETAERIA_94 [Mycobacterium phage Hetaeria]|uniref:Uncharacterized protein n=1 Tax=Mycobacterium phage Hetaeria TaxID=1700833 RepID=A0A0K2FIN7_9CAUD|nr:hypothetical protein HETAERIA_94 [Mycobacterium phage Hetaeria]AXH67189.1 hypothetical protein SEA_UACH1_95 [Mycobacterium phage UAch1]
MSTKSRAVRGRHRRLLGPPRVGEVEFLGPWLVRHEVHVNPAGVFILPRKIMPGTAASRRALRRGDRRAARRARHDST